MNHNSLNNIVFPLPCPTHLFVTKHLSLKTSLVNNSKKENVKERCDWCISGIEKLRTWELTVWTQMFFLMFIYTSTFFLDKRKKSGQGGTNSCQLVIAFVLVMLLILITFTAFYFHKLVQLLHQWIPHFNYRVSEQPIRLVFSLITLYFPMMPYKSSLSLVPVQGKSK